MSLLERVRALLGDDAVEIAGGPDAVPRVAPASPDAVALLLGTAREEGWRVRLEGAGTWLPADAPYDLTKLEAGGFGAFGVIVLVHLRLRALPRADQTFVLAGTREDLTQVAEDIVAAGLQPAALELMSPALARREGWALAVRLAGSAALVASQEAGLRGASGGRFTALRADEAHGFWMRAAESVATRPVTFRIGGLPDSSDELLDLLQHQVGDEWVSASPAVGAIRWAGDTTVDRLRRLRRTLAGLEVPLTLERAPWPMRSAVGHFGAYREGVGPLVASLRRTFDPGEAFVVAVEGSE